MDNVELARTLARIESKLDYVVLEQDKQKNHNELFYEVRDTVRDMKANANGAWFTVGIFGTLTIAVSGLVSWLVANFGGK